MAIPSAPQPVTTPTPLNNTPSWLDADALARRWEEVQAAHADLPGEDGARKRAVAYAPFFLRFGRDVFIATGCRFYHPQRIALDDDVRINENGLFYGSGGIVIGRHARIGPRVFVHSANHEIEPSPFAFHERGYLYRRVVIGDNCLLSANVSILPGVELGANSFIACGAVVPAGTHPEGSRLAGLPAKGMGAIPPQAEPIPAPTVLVIGCADEPRTKAMRHIVATLGLPQVTVVDEEETGRWIDLSSVRSVVQLSDNAPAIPRDVETWRLVGGHASPPSETLVIETSAGDSFHLPASRRTTIIPAISDRPPIQDAALLTLYHALKRLRKRRHEPADQVDLLLSATMLSLSEQRPDRIALRDRLLGLLASGHEANTASAVDPDVAEAIAALRQGGTNLAPVARAIIPRMRAGDAIKRRATKQNDLYYNERVLSACPELLPLMTMMPRRDDRDQTLAQQASVLDASEKAWIAACVACGAQLQNDHDLFDRAVERLLQDDLFDTDARCARAATTLSAGWSYQVLVGVVFALGAQHRDPDFAIEIEREVIDTWAFSPTGREEDAPVRLNGSMALCSRSNRTISASLIDSWMRAVTPPEIEHGQFELTHESYEPVAPALEAAWRAIFRELIHAAGETFVEIRPWPAQRRAAVSIRYDIDRATTVAQTMRIIELQRHCFGGPCGSWYDIPGHNHGRRLRTTLDQHAQELGVHGVRVDHPEYSGRGVTMHSAPASEYWRGRITLEGAAHHGATYVELLSTRVDRPQPVFFACAKPPDGPISRLWVTPLHFPLEGSTNDSDLSYFDRLQMHFRALLSRGGHLIIASHPDLNQELLAALADREDFSMCWAATVEQVVERCRRLFSPGAVAMVRPADGQPAHLLALETVADVTLRLEAPNGTPQFQTIQLITGRPRPIGFT